MFDLVVFDGFSKGLKITNNVLIRDVAGILTFDFKGAKNDQDIL